MVNNKIFTCLSLFNIFTFPSFFCSANSPQDLLFGGDAKRDFSRQKVATAGEPTLQKQPLSAFFRLNVNTVLYIREDRWLRGDGTLGRPFYKFVLRREPKKAGGTPLELENPLEDLIGLQELIAALIEACKRGAPKVVVNCMLSSELPAIEAVDNNNNNASKMEESG